MDNPRKPEEDRVNSLAGNQARIALLWLIHKGSLDPIAYIDIKLALEVAESYHPESPLKSF